MKGRPKQYSKRKPFCRKKGGSSGGFSFTGRPAGWGKSSMSFSSSVHERITNLFKNIHVFQPAPNKIMEQRLNRIMPQANRLEKKEEV